jgi:hypothetical protein
MIAITAAADKRMLTATQRSIASVRFYRRGVVASKAGAGLVQPADHGRLIDIKVKAVALSATLHQAGLRQNL